MGDTCFHSAINMLEADQEALAVYEIFRLGFVCRTAVPFSFGVCDLSVDHLILRYGVIQIRESIRRTSTVVGSVSVVSSGSRIMPVVSAGDIMVSWRFTRRTVMSSSMGRISEPVV